MAKRLARWSSGRSVSALLIGLIVVALVAPAGAGAQVQSGNVLQNADLEGDQYTEGLDTLAAGWRKFFRPKPAGAPAPEMNQPEFALKVNHRSQSGIKAQEWHRRWSTYEAGIWQQATVPVGAELTFSAWFFNISNTADDASSSNSVIAAQVGIDPTGGTDPFSPNVVWSENGRTMQQWYRLEVRTRAQNGTVTVFAKTRPDYPVTTNVSTVDNLTLSYTQTATATPAPSAPAPTVAPLPPNLPAERFFPQTGYWIANDRIWDYFNKRGGVTNFGYPVSNEFLLEGFPVQIFQRQVVQIAPNGDPRLINLLERSILPITQLNNSVLPAPDPAYERAAPPATDLDAVLQFIAERVPDEWEGLPVNFYQTFRSAVTCEAAFPNEPCNEALLPGFALELWGLPTSAPMRDPNNHNFVFQRWQRGIMHFDATTGATNAMLLADYFKAVLTGENLPPDVELQAAAANSKYLRQYSPNAPNGLARPDALSATNLAGAFTPTAPVGSPGAPPAVQPTPIPAPPPAPASGFGYGFQAHLIAFDPASKQRVVDLVRNAGFNWLKQQVEWKFIETAPGQYNWSEFDQIADIASRSGVKLLFSVVQAPTFYRSATSGHMPGDGPEYGSFRTFMQRLAERYRGKVQAYEIWNEQNLDREVGPNNVNPTNYVNLLKAGYNGVKAGDPNAIVVLGAPSLTGDIGNKAAVMDDVEYLQALYAVNGGEVKRYFDVLGAHPSGFANPPDAEPGSPGRAPGWNNHPSFFAFSRIRQYRDVMVANGDGQKKIWFTEFGYDATPTPPEGYGYAAYNSEQDQANDLRRAFEKSRQAPYNEYVGAMFVWNLNFQTVVGPTDEKWGFGVIRGDWSPRPAYSALAALPKQ